jgi:hypothetical protein
MASKRLHEEFWQELERARELLTMSPLLASLEQVAAPMSRAVETLRGGTGTEVLAAEGFAREDTERLAREVAGIGQLLDGLGDWLSTRGAIMPTYNCHAEFEPGASVGGSLAVEG